MKKMLFNEIGYTAHINKRVRERVGNIKNIIIPEDFFHSDESEKEKKLIKDDLKEKIYNELKRRLIDLRDIDFKTNKAITYKILLPVLERDGKKFKIDILTESEDENGVLKTYSGDLYVVIIASNVGITIMNVNSDEGESSLNARLIKYMKQGYETSTKSFSPLEFTINYSLQKEKLSNFYEKIKNTELGEVSLKKYNDLMSFIPGEEKSTSFLIDKIKDIESFILINKERINETEKINLESKKNSIQKRIDQILTSSERVVEKLQKKADYRKGAKFKHDKFGTGTIQKVEKFTNGVYTITVDFPVDGVKKIRAAVKQKPAETSAGLSESVTKIIRALIRQQQGL